ncbi:hypothetical protein [Salimicrobium halophilum]|uniref:Uncharacterized protein n=1 Tax=Salimicrobium halophilum TaxID=86666 RepID=A0A1G8UVK1_9BACI|nr:hypothetical protein [Salimicrobium halophilum]SDJ57886.1 hypothetical protein SAMN04490247_2430 [Salimicrobium halophilum]
MTNRYHCCATCKHFRIEVQENRSKRIYCERLGFDTKPTYQFNCWDPKERVKKAMEKESE